MTKTEMFTYTVNLSEKEANALVELANLKGVSKTTIFRQALRLYQMVAQAETVEIIVNGERKVVML